MQPPLCPPTITLTTATKTSAPTIIGFLLGFPVIYHCASDSLDAAVTALRNCSLTVLSCSGLLSPAQAEALERAGVRPAQRDEAGKHARTHSLTHSFTHSLSRSSIKPTFPALSPPFSAAHIISQFSFPSDWPHPRDGDTVAQVVQTWQQRTASAVQAHSGLSRLFTKVEHGLSRLAAGHGVTL